MPNVAGDPRPRRSRPIEKVRVVFADDRDDVAIELGRDVVRHCAHV